MGGSELKYVEEAFRSNWLSTTGPNLTRLEREISRRFGRPSLAVINGTAAIHLGLKLLGVKPGDEVVVPTFTFVASCNPILYEKATPVFIDSERASWNLDPQRLADFLAKRAASNKLPRSVIVVHLFGQSAELDSIIQVCRKYGLAILEDAAEALGAYYKGQPVGGFGDVAALSFNGNKVITSSGGGMLVSANPEFVQRARFWSAQACDPDGNRNYVHSEIGYNYRLSNVLAGIALGQLEVLDERVVKRRLIFERYASGFRELRGIEPQPEAEIATKEPQNFGVPSQDIITDESGGSQFLRNHRVNNRPRHTRWLSCFLIDEQTFGMAASDLIHFLDAANIEARPVWKPMHSQPLFRHCECVGGEVAEDLNSRGICLPSSSCLTEDEQQFVIDRVREAHLRAIKSDP